VDLERGGFGSAISEDLWGHPTASFNPRRGGRALGAAVGDEVLRERVQQRGGLPGVRAPRGRGATNKGAPVPCRREQKVEET